MSTPNVGSTPASTVPGSSASSFVVNAPSTDSDTAQQVTSLSQELAQAAAISELVARVSGASSVHVATNVLASELQQFLRCQAVAVGIHRGQDASCELTACSDRERIDGNSEYSRMAVAVLEECVARGQIGYWPPRESNLRYALLAHRQFADHANISFLMSVCLRDDDGKLSGVLLLLNNQEFTVPITNFVRAAEKPLASTIGLQLRAEGNRLDRFVSRLRSLCGRKKRDLLFAVAAVVAVVLLWPVTYRVPCECELQPVVRRFVAAPFDGTLKESFAEPGDIVKAGDILARIDAREINWELSGKRADVHRVMKERAGYLAGHESGKVELANLELERLNLEIDQLEHRFDNLDIRSPIAGIVVDGDLSKSEGVPLETGKPLYEIAPLEEMVVELWVPEDDVRFVEHAMPLKIMLDAFPMDRRESTVTRIHPRAELKEHDNVFIAEAPISNANGTLRPGMHGEAKVFTVRKPLGWILFHKPVTAAWAWLGW